VGDVVGTPARQVCVGSSVNSSYEDLAIVAAVLRGRSLPPELDLTVSPGSRQILDMIVRSGVYADLLTTGARILEPACGPCIGMGQAPAAGAVSVRTFNRNFPGRSGTADDRVYLCSPATAAATALHGVITDPRGLGEPPRLASPPANPAVDDRQIVPPLAPEEARLVEVEKGRNIVPPPPVPPLPETIEARVLIVVPDDVSTGDMAPDGALGLAIWSNIPACARFMFRRLDPDFAGRAEEWGGGIVVGGHNYGQGSSREQAAFAALHLGVRAVVAKSFARIHRTNLIAQAVLPYELADENDYECAALGQQRSIPVDVHGSEVLAQAPFGPVRLALRLTAREREVLLAGGLIAYAATAARGLRSG
jgi:aconitate hydratase